MLEVCVDSVESGIAAAKGGADRIELCANLIIGGTTPELSLFRILKEKIDIPINVMIRPRYGDFCYTDNEFKVMKQTVGDFIDSGADGFVFGILESDGCLDIDRLKILVDFVKGKRTTLHRCFDMCRDMESSLEEVIRLGFDTILTSGGENSCVDGIGTLKTLNALANGRIDIMAGAGINADNIKYIHDNSGITSFHMSGKTLLDSPMMYRKENVSMGIGAMSEYSIIRTDPSAIERASKSLDRQK